MINNAGIWRDDELGAIQQNTLGSVYLTNAVAPLLVSQQLLPQLSPGSKIIMITSRMGSIEDNTSGGRYAYRMSKAALHAASKSLALDLKSRDIIVGIIHPGHVATDMGGAKGIPVSEATSNIIQQINAYTPESTGTFKHANGSELPW